MSFPTTYWTVLAQATLDGGTAGRAESVGGVLRAIEERDPDALSSTGVPLVGVEGVQPAGGCCRAKGSAHTQAGGPCYSPA